MHEPTCAEMNKMIMPKCELCNWPAEYGHEEDCPRARQPPHGRCSESEQRARSMLTDAIQKGVPALDLMAAFGRNSLPSLSDDECVAIAVNYPLDWRDIRATFPAA